MKSFIVESVIINDIIILLSKNIINLDPIYQRNHVWTAERSSSYIQSLYLGMAPALLIFNKTKNKHNCIDGKQRITAIQKFINNEIPFDINGEIFYYDVNNKNILNAKCFLSLDEKNKFNNIKINIAYYDNISYIDELDIFNRNQNSVSLSNGELFLRLFTDERMANKFSDFCNIQANKFGKYINAKRKDHYPLIGNMMYIIGNKTLFDCHKLITLDFFDKLTIDDFDKYSSRVAFCINNCYNNNLLFHKNIKEIVAKNIQLVLIKFINEFDDIDYNKLLYAVMNVDKKCSDTNSSYLNKLYEQIVLLYNNYVENNNTTQKIKKQSIGKAKKKQIWDKWAGDDVAKILCYCCKDKIITAFDFVCGHIVSEFNGGGLGIKNIRPICNLCNSSMGIKNMIDFIKENEFKTMPDNKDEMKLLYDKYVLNNNKLIYKKMSKLSENKKIQNDNDESSEESIQ